MVSPTFKVDFSGHFCASFLSTEVVVYLHGNSSSRLEACNLVRASEFLGARAALLSLCPSKRIPDSEVGALISQCGSSILGAFQALRSSHVWTEKSSGGEWLCFASMQLAAANPRVTWPTHKTHLSSHLSFRPFLTWCRTGEKHLMH